MKPQRIQLRRYRGWNLQRVSLALNGLPAVSVARPGRWGNPFVIQFDPHSNYSPQTADDAVRMYREWLDGKRFLNGDIAPTFESIQLLLKGYNLGCWCRLGDPCHAETLLELASCGVDSAPVPGQGLQRNETRKQTSEAK